MRQERIKRLVTIENFVIDVSPRKGRAFFYRKDKKYRENIMLVFDRRGVRSHFIV
jgi:hypothetical protein